MKILVLYGQQHKGNTYKLTQKFLNKLNYNKEDIQEFYANGIPQCVGCCQCILKDEFLCPHREITNPIIKAMEESDVIIFSSPCYCFGMTGQLKSFCDHLGYRWMVHRPYDMRNKIGIAISTAAGGGSKKVTKSIAEQFFWWSIGTIYQLPFVINAENFDKINKKRIDRLENHIEKIAKKINSKVGNSKPSFKSRLLFKIMTIMHQKMPWNEIETKYWKSHGWIK